MKQTYILVVAFIGMFILAAILYALPEPRDTTVLLTDPKNATYIIAGEAVTLKNGKAETEAAPNSATKISTEYFGNELVTDLNADGRNDVVFFLTQNTGGSGTFFYVVAALNTENGYVGSEALFLGDRIAPQSINESAEKHIVVNYADRSIEESFDTPPSFGKSIVLIFNPQTRQFGEVVKDFEGEADPERMTLDMQTWNWISTTYYDGRVVTPRAEKTFTVTFDTTTTFNATTDCNNIGGAYIAKDGQLTFDNLISTKMFCAESQEVDFSENLNQVASYSFTSKGELILVLEDGGSMLFR